MNVKPMTCVPWGWSVWKRTASSHVSLVSPSLRMKRVALRTRGARAKARARAEGKKKKEQEEEEGEGEVIGGEVIEGGGHR